MPPVQFAPLSNGDVNAHLYMHSVWRLEEVDVKPSLSTQVGGVFCWVECLHTHMLLFFPQGPLSPIALFHESLHVDYNTSTSLSFTSYIMPWMFKIVCCAFALSLKCRAFWEKVLRFVLILDHCLLGTEGVIGAQEGTVDVDGTVHRSNQAGAFSYQGVWDLLSPASFFSITVFSLSTSVFLLSASDLCGEAMVPLSQLLLQETRAIPSHWIFISKKFLPKSFGHIPFFRILI